MECALYVLLVPVFVLCFLYASPLSHFFTKKRVGILYEGWHTPASNAMATIARSSGGPALSVDDVFMSMYST